MSESPRSYTAVPGSSALTTQRAGTSRAHALEQQDAATPVGARIGDVWLAQTLVRAHYIPVLEDVYDRLALDQEAEEQATYGHLYRLALGDERNFCRVSRRQLSQRTRMSDRRLGKALAGLVAKKHIALIERDRSGTLYRVFLPHEVFREAVPDAVLSVRERKKTRTARPDAKPIAGNLPSEARAASVALEPATPSSETSKIETIGGEKDRVSKSNSNDAPAFTIGTVAARYLERRGGADGRSHVVEEILGRLEEGISLQEIDAELAHFAHSAPKKTPLKELARFLSRNPRPT